MNVIEADRLGKRYRRTWALRDCGLPVPAGHVVALIGPNGAGKTTLLRLLAGLAEPSAGQVAILGGQRPGSGAVRDGVSYVDQQAPLYRDLRVRDILRVAAGMNGRWDQRLAEDRLAGLDIPTGRRAGRLSAGQQAQLALTLALARRPRLLLLDEPMAALDPLARQGAMAALMTSVAEDGTSVVLSSHVVSELERVASYLIILSAGQVQVAAPVDSLLEGHRARRGHRQADPCGAGRHRAARRAGVADPRVRDRQLPLHLGAGDQPGPVAPRHLPDPHRDRRGCRRGVRCGVRLVVPRRPVARRRHTGQGVGLGRLRAVPAGHGELDGIRDGARHARRRRDPPHRSRDGLVRRHLCRMPGPGGVAASPAAARPGAGRHPVAGALVQRAPGHSALERSGAELVAHRAGRPRAVPCGRTQRHDENGPERPGAHRPVAGHAPLRQLDRVPAARPARGVPADPGAHLADGLGIVGAGRGLAVPSRVLSGTVTTGPRSAVRPRAPGATR